MRKLWVFAALLVLICGAAAAQDDGDPAPNDPTVNEGANACFAGGSMEGKCALDADGDGVLEDFEAELLWACGWYLIRVEFGILPADGIPEWCPLSGLSSKCYKNFGYSFLYVGPPNTPGNAVLYFGSEDCTGEAMFQEDEFVVIADTEAEALAICSGFDPQPDFGNLAEIGWGTPANYWGCIISLQSRRAP